MKNIKSLCAVSLMATTMAFTSCTDLTEEPFNILTSDNYFTDKASVEATDSVPTNTPNGVVGTATAGSCKELTGDHFVWTQKGRHGYDDGQWVRLHEHKWNYDMNQINGGWVGPYQGIQQINSLLRDFNVLDFQAMGITDEEKNNYIGELRTLRAWFYIFLIDFYRNVPIFTEKDAPDELLAQATPEEVFSYIESELKDVLPQLKKKRISSVVSPRPQLRYYWPVSISIRRCGSMSIVRQTVKHSAKISLPVNTGNIISTRTITAIRSAPASKDTGHLNCCSNSPTNAMCTSSAVSMILSCITLPARLLGNPDGGNNGIHMTPSRDFDGNVYSFASQLGTPYEKYADCDYRKQPFQITSANGDYEGFFMIGTQYKFDYTKGYGYTNETVKGTEEYKGEPLIYVDQVGRFSEGLSTAKEKGSRVTTGEENSGVRFNKFPLFAGRRRTIYVPIRTGDPSNRNLLYAGRDQLQKRQQS